MADASIVVVPWYEPGDFARFAESRSSPRLIDYETWHEQATRAVTELTGHGFAIQIITVRLEDYETWLARTGRIDTRRARHRFLITLAGAAGGGGVLWRPTRRL